MEKEKEFLTHEELATQAHDFKNKWYGLAQKAEGLTNYKSGFDEGFKAAVKELYNDIDAGKDYIDNFEHSLKHYFPDHRSDITWMTKKVFRHLEELRVMAKKDFDVLEGSKELAQSLKGITEDLEKAEAKLKVAEEKSGEACRKYFDKKNDYTSEYKAIEEKTKKQMSKIREKFIEMTTPIVEGHGISLSSKDVSISELFELLSENPGDTEKITLVVKKGGIFGKKAETDLAKTSVLKYVSGEILEGVVPINKDKKKQIDKLKSEFSDISALEKACEESEKQRKKLERPAESLREKISDIKKSEIFKFADYDGILETREQYLDKLGESEKEVKEYLNFALLNLKGFAELEPDVEKRKLLVEIKGIKEKISTAEKDAAKAKDDLTAKIKELTSASDDASAVRAKITEINKKVESFEKTTLSSLEKFESDVQAKLSEITSLVKSKGKVNEEKVGKKLEGLRSPKKSK
jgi:chromosome segregation ATPase